MYIFYINIPTSIYIGTIHGIIVIDFRIIAFTLTQLSPQFSWISAPECIMESSSSSPPAVDVIAPPDLQRVQSMGIISVERSDGDNLCILTHMKSPSADSAEDSFKSLVRRSVKASNEDITDISEDCPIQLERSDGLHRDLIKVQSPGRSSTDPELSLSLGKGKVL